MGSPCLYKPVLAEGWGVKLGHGFGAQETALLFDSASTYANSKLRTPGEQLVEA